MPIKPYQLALFRLYFSLQNLLDAQHSLELALDPAKVLLRGYKDTTSIAKAQVLEALIDHLLQSGLTKEKED